MKINIFFNLHLFTMKDCPIYSLLELIGKKRVMMVFRSVHAGNHTFTQIKDNI